MHLAPESESRRRRVYTCFAVSGLPHSEEQLESNYYNPMMKRHFRHRGVSFTLFCAALLPGDQATIKPRRMEVRFHFLGCMVLPTPAEKLFGIEHLVYSIEVMQYGISDISFHSIVTNATECEKYTM